MKIRKAIIPCGGLGTRFLPATKAIPKEILPVIDTPVLAYIVDEIIAGGIDSIMIILGPGKSAIKDYFTESAKLEKALSGKPELLEVLRSANKKAEIVFGMQKYPRGSGDAVLQAKSFTGNEPFVMANGDDLIVNDVPAVKQLTDAYNDRQAAVVGVQKVERSEACKYGIIDPTEIIGKTVLCSSIVEKPQGEPPSLYAALGRYVLTPEVYDYIESLPKNSREIGLTDAVNRMMKNGEAYAYEFDGRRYDMGDKYGALTATVDFALKRPDLKDKFKKYLLSVLDNEN